MLTSRNQDLTTAKTGNSGFVPQILVVSYGRNPENRSIACGTRFLVQRQEAGCFLPVRFRTVCAVNAQTRLNCNPKAEWQ